MPVTNLENSQSPPGVLLARILRTGIGARFHRTLRACAFALTGCSLSSLVQPVAEAYAQPASSKNLDSGAPKERNKAVEGGPASVPQFEPPRLEESAPIAYPEGATGDARVVLHLTIGIDGAVERAVAIEGEAPFADAGERAARGWRFAPAHRGDQPVRAKIRFEVRFQEPVEAPAQAASDDAAPERAPQGAKPDKPAPPPPVEPQSIDVTVLGERAKPGVRTFGRAEIRQLPGAFGDPFRAIEALPGVTPIASGVPFFYVRGAPPGNVGYFIDGIRVPVLYHAGLGPSVIHPGLVENVELYSGAYPAEFGRFSGGIVSAEIRELSLSPRGEWNVRLFDAGALVEMPFADNRGHLSLGGRYSYTAALISMFVKDLRLSYWDYQGRASYDLTDDDTLSLFAFGSFDFFGEDSGKPKDQFFSTEFHRLSLRHRRRVSFQSSLDSEFTLGWETSAVQRGRDIVRQRMRGRVAYKEQSTPALRYELGSDLAADWFRLDLSELDSTDPDDASASKPTDDSEANASPHATDRPQSFGSETPGDEDEELIDQVRRLSPTRRDLTFGIYAQSAWRAAAGVTFEPGVRADLYASRGNVAWAIEPRLRVMFQVNEGLTLSNTFGIAHQPPSFVAPLPGLELSGLEDGLQQSLQSSMSATLKLGQIELGASIFHQVFLNTTDALSTIIVHGDSLTGDRLKGQAYGFELMLRRDLSKRLGGFVSYTLSRSDRLTGKGRFRSAFDRPHVLNAALGYDLGRRWRFGSRLVMYSGLPRKAPETTLPTLRDPTFYRIDARLEKRWLIGNGGAWWSLVIEMLNTTLNKEVIGDRCEFDEFGNETCGPNPVGPVAVPSLGVEGAF